jgi:RsiW-degrading membrane proteinase PrsW (M82 family)
MIKSLIFISVAPVFIIGIYVYLRDKYEKEPFINLLKALLTGILIVLPIVLIENILGTFSAGMTGLSRAAYNAFFVASITEEGLKYLAFILLVWNNRNFNEQFDGIVYAVFISLGFAAVENVIYVYKGGYDVGVVRALTAVPAHALFGTVMGYHLGLARFYPQQRPKQLILALLIPFVWHGTYDFLLMGHKQVLLILFIPFIVFFWINGFRNMKKLSDASIFRNDLFARKKPDGSSDQ